MLKPCGYNSSYSDISNDENLQRTYYDINPDKSRFACFCKRLKRPNAYVQSKTLQKVGSYNIVLFILIAETRVIC